MVKSVLKSKLKHKDIFLYELNYDFMKGFEVFLRDSFNNSTTTSYKHYKRFTRILNIAIQKGYLDRHLFPTYKIRMPRKKIEYLDQSELDRIENRDFKISKVIHYQRYIRFLLLQRFRCLKSH